MHRLVSLTQIKLLVFREIQLHFQLFLCVSCKQTYELGLVLLTAKSWGSSFVKKKDWAPRFIRLEAVGRGAVAGPLAVV